MLIEGNLKFMNTENFVLEPRDCKFCQFFWTKILKIATGGCQLSFKKISASIGGELY